MQVERAYKVYTQDCSSIQQEDVVDLTTSQFSSEIESCKQNDYDFNLPVKQDVYYDALVCRENFQSNLHGAFADNNLEVNVINES